MTATDELLALVSHDLRLHRDEWPLAEQFARRLDAVTAALLAERDDLAAKVAAVRDAVTQAGPMMPRAVVRRALGDQS